MAIKCPKCNADNPDTSSYCADCGTQLDTPEDIPVHTKTLETPFPQFSPGKSLANRYEIIRELGKGGMGEVYLAEDTNLKRQVAIKVLPQEFALDKERLARFEREARLLASLNHPNIATIHGLEKSNGHQFLVMELVEGDTLAEQIKRGVLPVNEVLEICRQIAEGLESAHEKGIIHRDLKPANIKITPEKSAKILDFGIAKAFHDQPDESVPSISPAVTDEMTRPGMVLGTAAYMSPEQAKGEAVDKKADIWAFGCLLYECLTGKRAFKGESVSETVASILKEEPNWNILPGTVPMMIRKLLSRCLVKNPKDRLHDIADARIEIVSAISQPHAEPAPPKTALRKKIFAAVILTFIITTIFGLILQRIMNKAPLQYVVRTTIDLPEDMQITRYSDYISFKEIALSPDGRSVFFSASPDGTAAKAMIYIRPLDAANATPIPGTEGGHAPFLSPDGQWLGFYAQGKLKKVLISSSAIPITICDCPEYPLGSTWSSDRSIIIGTTNFGLQMVDSEGGSLSSITTLDRSKESMHVLPFFVPDKKIVLFTVKPHPWGINSNIEALRIDSGDRKLLIEDGADARFTPTGHIVFMRESTLMAVPFDAEKLEVQGSPVPIFEGVFQSLNAISSGSNSGVGQFHFAKSGDLIYASGGIFPDPETHTAWLDQTGKVEPIVLLEKKPILSLRLSPDGRYLAYRTVGRNADVWIYDLNRATSRKLTREGRSMFPSWTPEGDRITFAYSKSGDTNIFWLPTDGSGRPEPLVESDYALYPGSWSNDGQYLVFVEQHPQTHSNIWIYKSEDQNSIPLLSEDYNESYPEISPDGRYLAYCSNETGRSEVYITSFPVPGRKILISAKGGLAPLWSPNGRILYYFSLDWNSLMAVEISTSPTFLPTTPRFVFNFPARGVSYLRQYDLALDGSKFLLIGREVITPIEVNRLNLVQNWFEELKEKVPSEK